MSSGDSDLSPGSRRHFLQALRRVLRPIVRLMIRNGIRYDEFADVARSAYVEIAVCGNKETKCAITAEQAAWITGIKGELVKHYTEDEGRFVTRIPTLRHVMTAVLRRWYTDSEYVDRHGMPLNLEFDAPKEPTFRGLVARIDPKSNADAILEELISAGSVAYSEERRIRPLTRFLIHRKDSAACIEYFSESLVRLIETYEHNFNPANSEKKRLDRTVFPDRGLPTHLLPSFQEFAKERANRLLSNLDDWIGRQANSGREQLDTKVETGMNVFLYIEEPIDSRPLSALTRARRNNPKREKKDL